MQRVDEIQEFTGNERLSNGFALLIMLAYHFDLLVNSLSSWDTFLGAINQSVSVGRQVARPPVS